jgi:glutamate mutase epsilon subunit
MSKLDIRISYKDACILKHALRNQCEFKQDSINDYYSSVEYMKNIPDHELPDNYLEESERLYKMVDEVKNDEKELEEEKRTLERFTEQIEECEFKHNRNIF